MKKGKYLTPRSAKRTNKKLVSLMLALALTIGGVVGGTLAWLTAETPAVTNTFAPSDINIELAETPNLDLKMVPGCEITKDPVVTVKAGSEACWLFVKIEKSANYDAYLEDYAVTSDWTPLTGVDGVYYCEVADLSAENAEDVVKYVLDGNKVTVKSEVTKAQMNKITNGTATNPTLTFTAYAIQKDNLPDQNNDNTVNAVDAWLLAKPATSGT